MENPDIPVFFPFGQPGSFLGQKASNTEELVRSLYGDCVEYYEIPQSQTYTEFAAAKSERQKFGAIVFGDAALSDEDLATLPTQDDLPVNDGRQLIRNSKPADVELPPPEMTPDIAAALADFDSEAAGYIRSGAINTNTRGRR